MGRVETRASPGKVLVENVWEVFRLYHSRPVGIMEVLTRSHKRVYEDFWALKGVTFHLERSESMAVIGANGSGKSTLLKCLAGILPPDRGTVDVGGKIAGLLELGVGFHPDLTGKENIYVNGSILGLKRAQIDRAYDEIVEFSGVEEFIDNPVRNFSSGMKLRLGFSVAIQVDPDVLLLDEVLAVGDAEFQARCFEKLESKRGNRTLVLVTHDLRSAKRLCERQILLEKGRLIASGPTEEVVEIYLSRVEQQAVPGVQPENKKL